MVVICRCGMRCRILKGRRHEVLVEIESNGSMVRMHRCQALRVIWSADGLRVLGEDLTLA